MVYLSFLRCQKSLDRIVYAYYLYSIFSFPRNTILSGHMHPKMFCSSIGAFRNSSEMLHTIDTISRYAKEHRDENQETKKQVRGCALMKARNDQMQDIRLCIQTYFNLYGSVPTEKALLEWLGASYEAVIPAFLQQKKTA